MKKFILTITGFFVIVLVLILGLLIYRYTVTTKISWKLPENTHILFMGASGVELAINDTLFPNSINLSSSSEKYLFTYLKLERILHENSQVDTLFLGFAPTDIWENTDIKYFLDNDMSYFFPLYFPLFTREEWKIYKNKKTSVITFLCNKLLKDIPRDIHSFGGFLPKYKEYDSQNGQSREWVVDPMKSGLEINYSYLKKIIELTKKRQVKLYFLYTPMYCPEDFYDQEYYYNAYKKYFSDVELFDYSHWDCPDHYRADEHHLNYKGACYFTLELRKRIRNDEI